MWSTVISFPNDKILDWSKLKAFAYNKIEVPTTMIFVFDRLENIVEKGENACYQHFLLFPQCFQNAFYSRSLEVGIVCLRFNSSLFTKESDVMTPRIKVLDNIVGNTGSQNVFHEQTPKFCHLSHLLFVAYKVFELVTQV